MTFDEISNSPCDVQGNTSQFVRRILENLVVSSGSIIYNAVFLFTCILEFNSVHMTYLSSLCTKQSACFCPLQREERERC